MGKFLYLEKDLAKFTDHKSVQKACDNGEVCIIYFPRDFAYHFELLPENKKTAELIKKDMLELYPHLHEV